MWTGVASDPRSESVRREYSNAAWVSAPSMWAECRPPPCGLSARPLHVGGGPAPSMWAECPPPPCGLRLRAAVRGFSGEQPRDVRCTPLRLPSPPRHSWTVQNTAGTCLVFEYHTLALLYWIRLNTRLLTNQALR
jgi:hypothetical protein